MEISGKIENKRVDIWIENIVKVARIDEGKSSSNQRIFRRLI